MRLERIDFPPYDKAVLVAKTIVDAIPDRVLWGTDFPHPNPSHVCDEADLVGLVPQFAPDPVKQKSCWSTTRRDCTVSISFDDNVRRRHDTI